MLLKQLVAIIESQNAIMTLLLNAQIKKNEHYDDEEAFEETIQIPVKLEDREHMPLFKQYWDEQERKIDITLLFLESTWDFSDDIDSIDAKLVDGHITGENSVKSTDEFWEFITNHGGIAQKMPTFNEWMAARK